jgi:hypothetical protein
VIDPTPRSTSERRRTPTATRAAVTSVFVEGFDAGVSFASWHLPSRALTRTVISNWSRGAWPIVRLLREAFDG